MYETAILQRTIIIVSQYNLFENEIISIIIYLQTVLPTTVEQTTVLQTSKYSTLGNSSIATTVAPQVIPQVIQEDGKNITNYLRKLLSVVRRVSLGLY